MTKLTKRQDSDQPGHPTSLLRVFAVHMKKAWVLSYPTESTVKTLIRLGGCTVIVFVLSWGGLFVLNITLVTLIPLVNYIKSVLRYRVVEPPHDKTNNMNQNEMCVQRKLRSEARSRMRALDWARAEFKTAHLNDSSRSPNILLSIFFQFLMGSFMGIKQTLSIYYNF